MNPIQSVPKLDETAISVFAQKGTQDDRQLPQTGNLNAVKVRRVLQLVDDLTDRPLSELRVLDLACGEGVYSIELGLRGSEVLGLDARTERMDAGAEIAMRHGLSNVSFQQEDVRQVNRDTHGEFDAILFLGILYHLDVPDSYDVLKNLYGMCRQVLIVDTHVSTVAPDSVQLGERKYAGQRRREHVDASSQADRQKRLLQSIDNTFNFWFTRESLIQLLADLGFTSVLECFVPIEPHKPRNRVTLVALKGESHRLACYPWLNELSEDQISNQLRPSGRRRSVKGRIQDSANAVLKRFGLELRRMHG